MKDAVVLALFVMLLSACKENEKPRLPEPSRNHWGISQALQNGKPWRAYPVCSQPDTLVPTIYIQLDSFTHYWTEILSFSDVPIIPGTYQVYAYQYSMWPDDRLRANFSYWNYDYPAASYSPLEGALNQLTIESFDSTTRAVKGSYDLTFILKELGTTLEVPDTIQFLNGTFHGRLYR